MKSTMKKFQILIIKQLKYQIKTFTDKSKKPQLKFPFKNYFYYFKFVYFTQQNQKILKIKKKYFL